MESVKFTEPEGNAQFVAFTPPTRMEGPDGEAITAGSQTYVNFFHGIKVEEIVDGGYNATKGKRQVEQSDVKTVRVTFDPESIGLGHSIAGNIAPDDPALDTLREALEKDLRVNVAIESIRMSRSRSSRESISPLTPIHSLLGATTPGGKGSMDAARENTSKVIAAVNGVTTKDARSDATQWASLSKNKTGNLPPEGFRLLTDKEDWTRVAVAVPLETAKPGTNDSAVSLDVEGLVEEIASRLENRLSTENGQMLRAPRAGQIGERRPFDIRTQRGDVNLGSYVTSKYYYTHAWAFDYLAGILQSKPSDEDTAALARTVLDLAGVVQVNAYGGGYDADVTLNSHTVATRWVEWHIEHVFPFTEDSEEWRKQVADASIAQMQKSGEWAGEALAVKTNSQNQSVSPKDAVAGNPGQGKSTPSKMDRLNAAMEATTKNFDDAEKLRAIYKAAQNEGLLGAPVAYVDKKVVFSDGADLTFGDLLIRRGKRIVETTSQETAPTQPEEAPQEEAPAPVEDSPIEETAPAPAEDAPSVADAPASDESGDEVLGLDAFAEALDAQIAEEEAEATASDEPEEDEASTSAPNDLGARIESIVDQESAAALWAEVRDLDLSVKVTVDGIESTAQEAISALNDKFVAAQEFAEEAQSADDMPALNAIRTKANKAGLLNLMVEDGVSDDPLTLSDALKARRASLKAGE